MSGSASSCWGILYVSGSPTIVKLTPTKSSPLMEMPDVCVCVCVCALISWMCESGMCLTFLFLLWRDRPLRALVVFTWQRLTSVIVIRLNFIAESKPTCLKCPKTKKNCQTEGLLRGVKKKKKALHWQHILIIPFSMFESHLRPRFHLFNNVFRKHFRLFVGLSLQW